MRAGDLKELSAAEQAGRSTVVTRPAAAPLPLTWYDTGSWSSLGAGGSGGTATAH